MWAELKESLSEESERRESEERDRGGGRKPPQTSIWQKQGAGLTLTTFDMWKLWEGKDAETTGRRQKKMKEKEAAIISPLCGCIFLHFQQRNECPLRVCPLGHNLSVCFDVLIAASSEVRYEFP